MQYVLIRWTCDSTFVNIFRRLGYMERTWNLLGFKHLTLNRRSWYTVLQIVYMNWTCDWHTGSAHRLDQVNNCLNFCENQLSCLGDMEPTANLIFKHMIDLELEGLWHRFGTLSQMLFEANYKEIECNIFRYKSIKTIDILVRD